MECSSANFLPLTSVILNKIKIYSAKGLFSKNYPGDPTQWKMRAYKYVIEKMSKEQFWNNRKILVIKNAEKDCKALFKDIKAIFHTDITLPIKEGSIARYYANPLSIKIYYNNDLEFDIRVDKYYHLDVLIIKDKRCVDSAYQTTIIYRDRSRETLYEPQIYTYIKGCKGTFNPLLNKKIVEINEIPIVISYNEDDEGVISKTCEVVSTYHPNRIIT